MPAYARKLVAFLTTAPRSSLGCQWLRNELETKHYIMAQMISMELLDMKKSCMKPAQIPLLDIQKLN